MNPGILIFGIYFFYLISALEITGENLEDLLAYDDLFLDYFNAFLALPVSNPLTLSCQSPLLLCSLTCPCTLVAYITNNMNPDQTAPLEG